MRTSYYCTVLDQYYLPRAWCLFLSLRKFVRTEQIIFFCLDRQSAQALRALHVPEACLRERESFLTPVLEEQCRHRLPNELAWTCKAIALEHLFNTVPDIDWAVYLDSDMFCFHDPGEGLALAGDADFLLTPHRFASSAFAAYEPLVGHYNAGFAAFRNTREGRRLVSWWKERCLESCPSQVENGIYSDQKYLDDLPRETETAPGFCHAGLNVAPWNIQAYAITKRGDKTYVGDSPLILYHFQGFQVVFQELFDYYSGDLLLSDAMTRLIYTPYAKALYGALRVFRELGVPLSTAWSKRKFAYISVGLFRSLMRKGNMFLPRFNQVRRDDWN